MDPRSPPLPPRARPLPSPGRQSPKPLGDKNPFRNSLKIDTNNPFAQQSIQPPPIKSDSEDEDLQRALLLSQEPNTEVEGSVAEAWEEERDRMVRKVRTSGPPPSPSLQAADPQSELPMIGPVQQSSPYFSAAPETKMPDWQQVNTLLNLFNQSRLTL